MLVKSGKTEEEAHDILKVLKHLFFIFYVCYFVSKRLFREFLFVHYYVVFFFSFLKDKVIY